MIPKKSCFSSSIRSSVCRARCGLIACDEHQSPHHYALEHEVLWFFRDDDGHSPTPTEEAPSIGLWLEVAFRLLSQECQASWLMTDRSFKLIIGVQMESDRRYIPSGLEWAQNGNGLCEVYFGDGESLGPLERKASAGIYCGTASVWSCEYYVHHISLNVVLNGYDN